MLPFVTATYSVGTDVTSTVSLDLFSPSVIRSVNLDPIVSVTKLVYFLLLKLSPIPALTNLYIWELVSSLPANVPDVVVNLEAPALIPFGTMIDSSPFPLRFVLKVKRSSDTITG